MGIRELLDLTKKLASGVHDYSLDNVNMFSKRETELLHEAHQNIRTAFNCIAEISKIKAGRASTP